MNLPNFQTDKLKIIDWINELEDSSIIEEVKTIMRLNECLLNDNQKKAIDEAINSIDKNGTIPHDIVMEETKKRYPNLFKK